MTYLDSYLSTVPNIALRDAIRSCASEFITRLNGIPSQGSPWYSLLLGHVQSGKTGQLLGVISTLADNGIVNFLLLTSDNRRLQAQTLSRAQKALPDFLVIGETDDVTFMTAPANKPVVVVLKKNTRVLQTWRNTILATARCNGAPLVIVDDEADATSLNTKVNSNSVSRINGLLGDIRDDASKCLYIQVTATPQAVLLQSSLSGWKPQFVVTIPAGKEYLGGRYYFSDPPSHAVRFTQEDEANTITKSKPENAEGLVGSVFAYLVNCGQIVATGGSCCNFLIHPSVRVSSHNAFVAKFEQYIKTLAQCTNSLSFEKSLKVAWDDLHSTYPEIQSFQKILATAKTLLIGRKIKIFTINSKSDENSSYEDGFNIVVGGNSLGRGLTLPKLQVVYYCRTSKTPQADTIWQHSRMFGYDRTRGLVRVFIPKSIHKIFYNICESNEVLFHQIHEKGLDGVQLIFPDGIRPTRQCVVDKDLLSLVQGGVNFFPFDPDESNAIQLDAMLSQYAGKDPIEISKPDFLAILNALGAYDPEDWDKNKFIHCAASISKMSQGATFKIIVRRDRDVSKATGSLLSANDRNLVDSLVTDVALVLYRLNGKMEHGWNGHPFWIPNIRFPDGLTFYSEN